MNVPNFDTSLLRGHESMENNITTDMTKSKDEEQESKKAQEVIGLLLSKPEDCSDEILHVDFSAGKLVQDSPNTAVTVSIAGSSPLNICHVSLTDAGMLLESGDIQHSLACTASSIQLDDGTTLIQNYESVDESESSDATAKFIDGQAVQLEDGTTAFIHAAPREGLQPVQLEDGTMAYLSQTGGELFNGEASTLDLESFTSPQVNDTVTKEFDTRLKEAYTGNEPSKPAERTFRCVYDGCRRPFTTLHHLKVHERSHTGDRPFKCAMNGCGKAFATGYGLKSHTRVHTGETPYKCPDDNCHKAFKTSGDLQKHVRTHTGERPFKCPFNGCDRAFTTSNIRKVHIRTHTGERPYVCKLKGCERAFASATNYKNHMRIHTGEKPYVCAVTGCSKRFTEYSSLYKHHVVHTHSKPYNCNLCGKTYRQTSTLAMHKRTAHGIVEPNDSVTATNPDEDISDPVKHETDSATQTEPLICKAKTELENESQSIDVQNSSTDVTSVNTANSVVISGQVENANEIVNEHPMYAVQLQEVTPGVQQIVLVTDPEQIAALQQLSQQGQLETVLTLTDQNTTSEAS